MRKTGWSAASTSEEEKPSPVSFLRVRGRFGEWEGEDGTSGWKNDWIDATCGAIVSWWSVDCGKSEAQAQVKMT